MKQHWLYLVACLVIALVAIAWLAGGESRAVRTQPSDAGAVAASTEESRFGASDTTVGARSKVPPRKSAAKDLASTGAEFATLHLEIVGPLMESAHGRIFWRSERDAPAVSDDLLPAQEVGASDSETHSKTFASRTEIRVPAATWTRLRIALAGPTPQTHFRYVEPFSGERRIRIVLRGVTRAIHVHLLSTDASKPAPRREIRLFSRDLAKDAIEYRKALETNENGYAVFSGLQPGAYLVCAPGASPGDAYPYSKMFMMAGAQAWTEVNTTLVARPESVRVRMRVDAPPKGFEMWTQVRPSPKLVLEGVDGLRSGAFPCRSTLTPGRSTVEFRVPAGSYRLRVVPLGSLRVAAGQELVVVRPSMQAVIPRRVDPPLRQIRVSLEGLEDRDFPVTVHPLPVDGVLDLRHERYFIGPYRWQRAVAKIYPPEEPARLLVSSMKRRFWIARSPCGFARGQEVVSLVPATQVFVFWERKNQQDFEAVHLVVKLHDVTNIIIPHTILMRQRGRDHRVLSAQFVVPRGRFTVSCERDSGAGELWREVRNATEPRMSLRIASQ